MRFKARSPVVSLADGVLLGLLECAADDQPHPAVVGDERRDPARGERQRVGGKITGHAVVLNGAGEGRVVEQLDQVAIFVAITGAPLESC
jgi:hypothetical protein